MTQKVAQPAASSTLVDLLGDAEGELCDVLAASGISSDAAPQAHARSVSAP